ncbi:MAG: protein translocase subunit SecD [Planctomycetota bacterium]
MDFLPCLDVLNDWIGFAQTNVTREISNTKLLLLVTAAAVLILPFIAGHYIAKGLKMPNYGTRLGFILLAIIASAVTLYNKFPSLGVDLRGGTILVYQIDPEKQRERSESNQEPITSQDLIEPLIRRINPSGTQEIVIRPYGEEQIEIIVPEVDQREVDRIKKLVEDAGQLRFAIVANQADHQAIISTAIDRASEGQTSPMVGSVTDAKYGRWVTIGRESDSIDGIQPLRMPVGNAVVRNPKTGQIVTPPVETRGADEEFKIATWMKAQDIPELEILTIIDSLLDITGEDLSYAASTFDQNGSPAVAFNLTDQGSGRFFALTTNNSPEGTRQRQLGIVLDDTLLSAPNILQPIRKEGRITGNFTRDEVDRLVKILKAGQLPATVTKKPIAENQIDATLGADTIKKGVYAIAVSLSLVLIFILCYYLFAGAVACIALIMNLAMILATMVFINQPLTLPGLAGLVLTVGMSVDANVLIFERIREELNKGAKARMAIRNGFARATTTIVDANLTTLITAIVLYAIGTDQIRGFAVTLILGILFSMFTAIYVSRTLFDLAERHGFLNLKMFNGIAAVRGALAGGGDFDFTGKGRLSLTLSAILVAVGIGALVMRGGGIFDIDFAGGSSVQFRLDSPTPAENVRKIVGDSFENAGDEKAQFTIAGVSMESAEEDTVYKVDSSIERVEDLKAAVAAAFADSSEVGLVTYQVDVQAADLGPKPDEQGSIQYRSRDRSYLTSADGITLAMAMQEGTTESNDDDSGAAPESEADSESEPADSESTGSSAVPVLAFSTSDISLGIEDGAVAVINQDALQSAIESAAETAGVTMNARGVVLKPRGDGAELWQDGSVLKFSDWRVQLPLTGDNATKVMTELQSELSGEPVWISSSSVGSRVAGDMVSRALGALFASLLCIIGYIWFRFQRVIYGVAAVVALVHDVSITLGAIAVSYWLAGALGFLLIDPFKISLTVVAALLTIIGYSLNDTIVVFDRIRETKGKAPRLTGDMINTSINQTLSRTLLTSLTTLIVVVLLYAFGGEGIHAFAFCLVVGVLVGTYSSIFVASPVLLYLVQRGEKTA